MTFPLSLDGFDGQAIAVQPATFFAGPKLLVNGQPAPKGPKRGTMLLRRNDGTDVVAKWKPMFAGLDLPALVVGDKTIQLVPPLPWYQWVWSALPILLIVIGGALGAITGIIAASINVKVFRTPLPEALKYVVAAVVSGGAVVVYMLAATLFVMLITR